MIKNTRIGLAIIIFGGYTLYNEDVREALLYFSVGLGVAVMVSVKYRRVEAYCKIRRVILWVFVVLGIILHGIQYWH